MSAAIKKQKEVKQENLFNKFKNWNTIVASREDEGDYSQ